MIRSERFSAKGIELQRRPTVVVESRRVYLSDRSESHVIVKRTVEKALTHQARIWSAKFGITIIQMRRMIIRAAGDVGLSIESVAVEIEGCRSKKGRKRWDVLHKVLAGVRDLVRQEWQSLMRPAVHGRVAHKLPRGSRETGRTTKPGSHSNTH